MKNNELKIGILVVAVIAILGYLTWEAGDYDFTPEGYRLKVLFNSVDGVTLNAPVTLNGFEVGRIEDIRMAYGKKTRVQLTLWIDIDAKVHSGATVLVKNMGFMGEKYVGLTSGDEGQPLLKDNDVIIGTDPGSLETILSDGEVIAANIKEISENIKERLRINSESIDKIVVDMRVSMKNISAISENVNERLEVNKLLIDDTIAKMNAASNNIEEMSYDLKLNPWKLMYKEPRDIFRGNTKK